MKVELDNSIFIPLWTDVVLAMENQDYLTSSQGTALIGALVNASQKYDGCTAIGDWSISTEFITYAKKRLITRLLHYMPLITKMYTDPDGKYAVPSIPTNKKETITKSSKNDTFTMGEIAPVSAPSTMPNLSNNYSGIDSPNTKNRGQYVGNSTDGHNTESPEYYREAFDIMNENPTIVDITQIIFEPLVYEYSKWY